MIIAIICIWQLTRTWLKPYIIEALGGYTERELVTTTDAVNITVDTIYLPKKERIIDIKYIPVPTKESTAESTTKGNLNELSLKTDSIYRYKTAISDSLIDGNIITLISLKDCKLVSQSLNYTPKMPILVEKTTTIERTNTEVLKNKDRVRIGIGAILNSNISAGVMGVYQTSKGLQYQAGYVFEKQSLENQFKSKQGYISVSIIKLF